MKAKLKTIIAQDLHQSWCAVLLCVGVAVGTVVGLACRVKYFASPAWALVAAILLIYAYLKPKRILVALSLVAGVLLAFCRVAVELVGEDYIRQFHGQMITVSGKVQADPETDGGSTKFKLGELKFGESGEHAASGSIYVASRRLDELARSDIIILRGKLLEGFGAYAGYMYQPEVVSLKKPEPEDPVLAARNFFAARVRELLPEKQANLGLSYLLGMKTGLDNELDAALRVVGLTHIVVASGAHLSILVEIARKIFGKVSRFTGLACSVAFILFFMAMVGWTPSIMRAGAMAILTLVSWYVGRKIAAWRLILMVAAITLILNPNFLINLGWQLSFASYAGIMMLGPRLTKVFYGQKKPGLIGGMILTTVAATAMTLPVILYQYGTVSLISVVANLLILPTLPYAMGLVFFAGVVAGVPGVEAVAGWCATRLLDYHIAVVEWLGGMRQFLVEIEPRQGWVWALYGVVGALAVVYILWHRKVSQDDKKYDMIE